MFTVIVRLILKIVFTLTLLPFRFFSISVFRARNKVLFVRWGRNRIDTAPVQTRLERRGMPTAPVAYTTLGGGMYGVHAGRLLTEMTGDGGGRGLLKGLYQFSAGGGGGFMNVGYLLKRGGFFRLYPVVGIGGGVMGALVSENGPETEAVGNSIGVGSAGPMLNFGLGMELKLGRRFGIMTGFRVGLLISPYEIFGSSKTLTPYAHFIGGFGSFDRRKRKSR